MPYYIFKVTKHRLVVLLWVIFYLECTVSIKKKLGRKLTYYWLVANYLPTTELDTVSNCDWDIR